MSLTKHYYAVDEVRAALAYACKEHKQEEAIFWCNELVVSNMANQALETLMDTWLWTYGPCKLFWLACAQHTEKDRLPRLAQMLAAMEHDLQDGSLWIILRETKEQPDTIVGWGGTEKLVPVQGWPLAAQPLATYFLAAAKEHKGACAWWAASQLGIDDTLLLARMARPERASWLQTIADTHLPGYEKALHCLIALVASMWDSLWLSSIKAIPVPKDIPLKAHSGPREARRFAIPQICLYGITARGKMRATENTLSLLRSIELSLTGPYWNVVLAKVGAKRAPDGKIEWPSEDVLEEFYEEHFPDDIPDEWPLAEQMKSHGPGVLGPSEIMTIDKQMRIWIPRRQRLTWLKAEPADDLVGPLSELAINTDIEMTEDDMLEPVKKVYKIKRL